MSQSSSLEGTSARLQTCPCCGLAQRVPRPPDGMLARCPRCHTTLRLRLARRPGNGGAAAVAVAALILYPLAVTLPILRVEKLGLTNEASVLTGVRQLFVDGHLLIGAVVFACSIVFPLFKLVSLVVLSVGARALADRHRATTYRFVEWTGRYGMLDILLVAVLVAVLKLGDLVTVTAGPGAVAFAGCVLLSLLAAAVFDPHGLWEPQS